MDGIWSARRHGDHLECLTSKGKKILKSYRAQNQTPLMNNHLQQQQLLQQQQQSLLQRAQQQPLLMQEKHSLKESNLVPVLESATESVHQAQPLIFDQAPTVSAPSSIEYHSPPTCVLSNSEFKGVNNLQDRSGQSEHSVRSLSKQERLDLLPIVPVPAVVAPSLPKTSPRSDSPLIDQCDRSTPSRRNLHDDISRSPGGSKFERQSPSSDTELNSGRNRRHVLVNLGKGDEDEEEEDDDRRGEKDEMIKSKNIQIIPKRSECWSRRGGVELCWSEVGVCLEGRSVLRGVSGHCRPGQLVAIMGSSGSGKTTLLNALSGRQRCTDGSVTIGGRPLSRKSRHLVGYSTQHDLFHPNLRLRQMLQFTAELRLPHTLSYEDKMAKLNSIITMLGLTHCLDTIMGDDSVRGLSGGERKRASIACELLTDPPVLVLDEPTSGLDAHAAHALVSRLKTLAVQEGRSVVMSLHQPSSRIFHMLDTVLLLCDGQMAFQGNCSEVAPYLARLNLHLSPHYNPADFLLEVANEHSELLLNHFETCKHGPSTTTRLHTDPDSRLNPSTSHYITSTNADNVTILSERLSTQRPQHDRLILSPDTNSYQLLNNSANPSGGQTGNQTSSGDTPRTLALPNVNDDSFILPRVHIAREGDDHQHRRHQPDQQDHPHGHQLNEEESNNNRFLKGLLSTSCRNVEKGGSYHQNLRNSSAVLPRVSTGKSDTLEVTLSSEKLSASMPDVHNLLTKSDLTSEERKRVLDQRTRPRPLKKDDNDSGRESCSSDHSEAGSCAGPPLPLGARGALALDNTSDARWPASYWTQCRVLTARSFVVYRPIITSKTNWIQTLCLGLLAGFVWFQAPRTEQGLTDLQGWMFFSAHYWMAHSHFQAVHTFPSEKAVLQKERESGWYRISAYYIAKTVSELPLTIALPALYFLVSYPMMGVTGALSMLLLLLMLLLNSLVAQSMGLLVSVAFSSVQQRWAISALVTLFQQLFGGFLTSHVPAWLEWARYLSLVHYVFRGMCIIEFSMGPPISCSPGVSRFPSCVGAGSNSSIPVEEILAEKGGGAAELSLGACTSALLFYLLLVRLLAYLVLRFRYRPNY